MSADTLVKQDWLGLYVDAGGWISRPFTLKTKYSAGDTVRTCFFRDSRKAGVGDPGTVFETPNQDYELWIATGISTYDYSTGKIVEYKYVHHEEFPFKGGYKRIVLTGKNFKARVEEDFNQ